MAPPEVPKLLRTLILGTDALLEARPATPIQLARACMRLGFDFIAPVSWGEELLASQVIEAVRPDASGSAIIAHCPFVIEAVRAMGTPPSPCLFAVAPPVATARYTRAAFRPRELFITYAGRCPGASAPDIDELVLPEVLLNRLAEARILPDQEPLYFEEQVPPDRSRYCSLAGGIPEQSVLLAASGKQLREAAPATLQAVLPAAGSPHGVVIDLETATGCACARDRFAASQQEPPRAASPVVSAQIRVDLGSDRLPRLGEPPERRAAEPERSKQSPPGRAPARAVAQAGSVDWSHGEERTDSWPVTTREKTARVVPMPVSPDLTGTVEPWLRTPSPRRSPAQAPEAAPTGDRSVAGEVAVAIPVMVATDTVGEPSPKETGEDSGAPADREVAITVAGAAIRFDELLAAMEADAAVSELLAPEPPTEPAPSDTATESSAPEVGIETGSVPAIDVPDHRAADDADAVEAAPDTAAAVASDMGAPIAPDIVQGIDATRKADDRGHEPRIAEQPEAAPAPEPAPPAAERRAVLASRTAPRLNKSGAAERVAREEHEAPSPGIRRATLISLIGALGALAIVVAALRLSEWLGQRGADPPGAVTPSLPPLRVTTPPTDTAAGGVELAQPVDRVAPRPGATRIDSASTVPERRRRRSGPQPRIDTVQAPRA
jgi:hypothetical protein